MTRRTASRRCPDVAYVGRHHVAAEVVDHFSDLVDALLAATRARRSARLVSGLWNRTAPVSRRRFRPRGIPSVRRKVIVSKQHALFVDLAAVGGMEPGQVCRRFRRGARERGDSTGRSGRCWSPGHHCDVRQVGAAVVRSLTAYTSPASCRHAGGSLDGGAPSSRGAPECVRGVGDQVAVRIEQQRWKSSRLGCSTVKRRTKTKPRLAVPSCHGIYDR